VKETFNTYCLNITTLSAVDGKKAIVMHVRLVRYFINWLTI